MDILTDKRILLIISGGIAAYKSLELIRLLKKRGAKVRPILTRGGAQFVTPLSVSALCEDKVYGEIFDLTDEADMGHIQLSRDADLLVIAPATANLLAKFRAGIADDLASTTLLATDKPVLAAPAMNVRMWEHPATKDNIDVLARRGTNFVGPTEGDMACGEYGFGRMAEPHDILAAIETQLQTINTALPLAGIRILVTAGPTREPIDPVRYISNHSSGKQGFAIAEALAHFGAETVLISGPVDLPPPTGVEYHKIETAMDLLQACQKQLPVEVAICTAAVADWRVAKISAYKIKKTAAEKPSIEFTENPDILAELSKPGPLRPKLVIGFAAETDNLLPNAHDKLSRKGCDWIVANHISTDNPAFGHDYNHVHLLDIEKKEENWGQMTKREIGYRLAKRITATIGAWAG